MSDFKHKLSGKTRSIRSRINKKCNYQYDYYAMRSYCGEGFYVNNKILCQTIQTTYGYDIHWAYGAALTQYKFPITSNVSSKPSPLGVKLIYFTYYKPRYNDFYYTIYIKNMFHIKNSKFTYLWLTNFDYTIFMDLYESDAKIADEKYYQDIDYLPSSLKELVQQDYIEKKKPENKDFKSLYEAAYYGMFAKDLLKHKNKCSNLYEATDAMEIAEAQAITGLSGKEYEKQQIRTRYCVIATFQAAYTRLKEWHHFKENMNNVIYMNTDSIYSIKPLNLGEDKGLGYYKLEYDALPILYARRNCYIVLNKDFSIYKCVMGGCIDETLPDWKIDLLKNGFPIMVHSLDEDGKVITIELEPYFINNIY